MKLEYLDDLTENGMYPYADPVRLIRLYDFRQAEAAGLISILELALLEQGREVDLGAVGFIELVNCRLSFTFSPEDRGIQLPAPNNEFVCALTREGYEKLIGNMEFAVKEELSGYNWLYDAGSGAVDLLFSPGGTW